MLFVKRTRGAAAATLNDLASCWVLAELEKVQGGTAGEPISGAVQAAALTTPPTSLCIDESGRVLVTETHRFRYGIPDNRDHRYWHADDIAALSVEDRRKMH